MKVKDLINNLSKFDPESEIYTYNRNMFYYVPDNIEYEEIELAIYRNFNGRKIILPKDENVAEAYCLTFEESIKGIIKME